MAVSIVSSSRLRRVLPFRTVVSTSTGLAYAAISLVSCVQIAAFMAGDSAWIALFIAGLLALLALMALIAFFDVQRIATGQFPGTR